MTFTNTLLCLSPPVPKPSDRTHGVQIINTDREGGMYYTTETACSCPDWQYRGRDRPCKHVERLRTALETVKGQREHNAALQAAQGAQTPAGGEHGDGQADTQDRGAS